MALQTLPTQATEYTKAQVATIADIEAVVAERWVAMGGTQFDTAWQIVGPAIVAAVLGGQRDVTNRATAYIPAVLAATGQEAAVEATDTPLPEALIGLTGAGMLVQDALSAVTIRAKQAITAGATVGQASTVAQTWLRGATRTILADTARSSESLNSYVRPVTGFVRVVNGNACGRCVILAGRWYRINADFPRHDNCRCSQMPAAENIAGHWRTDPRAYFETLNDEQRIKLMGSKANAQAVADGADMGQIINAYRTGIKFAQNGDRFTTEGTTRRGFAAQQQAGLRRNGPSQLRLMPQSIARIAKDADDRMRLLRLYGWVVDLAARERGRELLAAARG